MPENPRDFILRANAEAEKLTTEDCYITSIANPGFDANHVAGRIVTATRKLAGHYIALGTHRISTPEEIEHFHKDHVRRRAEILKEESDKQPRTYMDPEIMAAMTTVATNAATTARQFSQKENT